MLTRLIKWCIAHYSGSYVRQEDCCSHERMDAAQEHPCPDCGYEPLREIF